MKRTAFRRWGAALLAAALFAGIFYYRHHFTPQRWQSLRNRGNLVGSLFRQYDDLLGMTEPELDRLLGAVSTSTEDWRGERRRYYWIGSGRGLEWFPEYMVVYFQDGVVSRVEFEWA